MPQYISKGLEDKIVGLIAQLAVTNETLLNVGKAVQDHTAFIYGNGGEPDGGAVTRIRLTEKTLSDHTAILDRLENSCGKVMEFMVAQAETNKQQADATKSMQRVVYGLAGVVFLVLLLIGAADIGALRNLLSVLHF